MSLNAENVWTGLWCAFLVTTVLVAAQADSTARRLAHPHDAGQYNQARRATRRLLSCTAVLASLGVLFPSQVL